MICECPTISSHSILFVQPDLHRHGLSKPALQGIVNTQKDKWPTSALGKFTQKTTMATMRAAFLDQELGFTIRVLEPVQSNLPDGHDEGQVQGSPNENLSQTMAAASADRTVKVNLNKPGMFMLEYPTCHCSLSPFRTGPSK
jgi:hypothetical protein